MIDAVVTRLLLHRIYPTLTPAVLALLLLGVGWHLYIGCKIGENGSYYWLMFFNLNTNTGNNGFHRNYIYVGLPNNWTRICRTFKK